MQRIYDHDQLSGMITQLRALANTLSNLVNAHMAEYEVGGRYYSSADKSPGRLVDRDREKEEEASAEETEQWQSIEAIGAALRAFESQVNRVDLAFVADPMAQEFKDLYAAFQEIHEDHLTVRDLAETLLDSWSIAADDYVEPDEGGSGEGDKKRKRL